MHYMFVMRYDNETGCFPVETEAGSQEAEHLALLKCRGSYIEFNLSGLEMTAEEKVDEAEALCPTIIACFKSDAEITTVFAE